MFIRHARVRDLLHGQSPIFHNETIDHRHFSGIFFSRRRGGRPDLESPSMLYRPRLNSATHFFIIVYDGAVPPHIVSMASWISFGVNLFIT